jgi:FtsZ-interacting cell division protein ZipA
MGRVILIVGAVILLAIVVGGLWLAYSDFPTQRIPVQKVLPDARFPK